MFFNKQNPFTFDILPELFVGYRNELRELSSAIQRGDKFCLITAPSGYGKTAMMKFLSKQKPFENGQRWRTLYLPRPPSRPEEWVGVFRRVVWFLGSHLYDLPTKLNRKLKEPCLMLVDEVHEAQPDCLGWLRVISEHVENISIVLAAMPEFEPPQSIKNRITTHIKLNGLGRTETGELIKRRLELSRNRLSFNQEAIDVIHVQSRGCPREILKLCAQIVHKATEMGITTVDLALLREMGYMNVWTLSEKQKVILALLAERAGLTPTELLSLFNPGYKDTGNGIRALNNILKRLLARGLIERQKIGKAYKYVVRGELRFLFEQTIANPMPNGNI